MLPVPWRYIQDWNCPACGQCCRGFQVVLNYVEWVSIVKTYGVEFTEPSISQFCIKRKNDGTCIFLHNYHGSCLCGLQNMKPLACKLWPFKISNQPRYGRANEAEYNRGEVKLYVYVDPFCVGLKWGTPTQEFMNTKLAEFVDVALGIRKKQNYSTARLFLSQPWKTT